MKPLLELSNRECRWPVAEDRQRRHLFCGARTSEGCAYCELHRQMSVVPDDELPDWFTELDEMFGVKR